MGLRYERDLHGNQSLNKFPRMFRRKTMEEDTEKKQTKTSSRKWWILLVVLIVLTIAVAYNFEHLPKMQQFNALLENSTASSDRQ